MESLNDSSFNYKFCKWSNNMSNCNCDDETNNAVPDLTKASKSALQSTQANSSALAFDQNTLAAKISACVAATYNNGQICVNFPIVGNICFAVPVHIPVGAAVKVCMETCGFRFGVPPFNGIKASVYLNDQVVWTGTIYGSC